MHYNRVAKVHVGNVNWDIHLGPYYLDLTETLVDYSDFRYGEFDDTGVPLVGWGSKAYYSPVNIAQFGFILHDLWLKQKDNKEYFDRLEHILQWFEDNKEIRHNSYVWPERVADRYGAPEGSVSAMTAGEVLSFYLRMYQIKPRPELLESSMKIFRSYLIPFEEGGFRRYDKNGFLWYEEYRSPQPSFVLNGFIYAIWGLVDLFRVTGDPEVKIELDESLRTLRSNIHQYHVWYWSLYDQLKKELVMMYYQENVHLPQIRVMHQLTGDDIYQRYANKWARQLNPINKVFVQIMYRIKPRLDKLLR
jgi:hypothetical protein